MIDLKKYLNSIYENCIEGIYLSGKYGYWSNLSEKKNIEFSKVLEKNDCFRKKRSCVITFKS